MEEKVRENLRNEEIKKIVDTMNDEYGISKVRELIKDNKIEFDFDGKQYRVRLLTAKEKDELDYLRRKKFGQLLQDKDILLSGSLIKLYEERGIKISDLDTEISKINKKIADTNYKLGKALADKLCENILKTYREEIEKLANELYEVLVKKNHLLEFTLENQLANYVAKIISYLSLDIKVKKEWVRAYNNVEDFMSADDKLINITATYSMTLHNNI